MIFRKAVETSSFQVMARLNDNTIIIVLSTHDHQISWPYIIALYEEVRKRNEYFLIHKNKDEVC